MRQLCLHLSMSYFVRTSTPTVQSLDRWLGLDFASSVSTYDLFIRMIKIEYIFVNCKSSKVPGPGMRNLRNLRRPSLPLIPRIPFVLELSDRMGPWIQITHQLSPLPMIFLPYWTMCQVHSPILRRTHSSKQSQLRGRAEWCAFIQSLMWHCQLWRILRSWPWWIGTEIVLQCWLYDDAMRYRCCLIGG